MTTPRVLVVDDHALFRAGVRSELEGRVDVVGDAETVAEAVAAIRGERPDVVLLDVHMPDGGGVAVIEAVADDLQPPRFLALSASDAAGLRSLVVTPLCAQLAGADVRQRIR